MNKQILNRLEELNLSNEAIAVISTMYDNGNIIDVDIFDTNDEPFDIDNIDSYELVETPKVRESDYNRGKDISYFGENYLVFADDIWAKNAAEEAVQKLIKSKGVSIINPESINIEDYIDTEWFEDNARQYFEDTAYMSLDKRSERFANKLIEDCYNYDIINEDDFMPTSYGVNYFKCLLDEDDLIDKYIDYHMDDIKDYVQYFIDKNGEDEFNESLMYNELIDLNKLSEDLVDMDGPGHYLAEYDGIEHKLRFNGNDYYIYRI